MASRYLSTLFLLPSHSSHKNSRWELVGSAPPPSTSAIPAPPSSTPTQAIAIAQLARRRLVVGRETDMGMRLEGVGVRRGDRSMEGSGLRRRMRGMFIWKGDGWGGGGKK